jgi:2-methylcitrate dehydratase PrpD
MQADPTYIERFVSFAYGCRMSDIPSDVRRKAALFVLDALGVAIGNRDKAFVRQLAATVVASTREGACTAVASRPQLVAEGAAAINSTAIHGNDFDATHIVSIMHPSAVVVPTVLAVAEESGASGEEVIATLVAGFELLIRMGLATRGTLHRSGFQSTALCAPVVLSILACRLYGATPDVAVNASGLAASLAAGLRAFSDDGTWGKRVITGWSCKAGLAAAALARQGYSGSRDALEKKPFGFYPAFHQNGGYDLTELTKAFGERWDTRDIDLKRYPCSHGHHAFIATARRARRELGLEPGAIQSVQLHVSAEARKWWFEPKERKYELTDNSGARFAMPYTIALALLHGDVTDRQLESRDSLTDPALQRIVQRVVPKVDASLQNANPNHLPGTVEIVTSDGRAHVFKGEGTAHGGDFEQAVLEKFAANVEGDAAAQPLVDFADRLEKLSDVRAMMRSIAPRA